MTWLWARLGTDGVARVKSAPHTPRRALEPPPVSLARGPPIDWGELVQVHDNREAVQVAPDELPVIDIHSL